MLNSLSDEIILPSFLRMWSKKTQTPREKCLNPFLDVAGYIYISSMGTTNKFLADRSVESEFDDELFDFMSDDACDTGSGVPLPLSVTAPLLSLLLLHWLSVIAMTLGHQACPWALAYQHLQLHHRIVLRVHQKFRIHIQVGIYLQIHHCPLLLHQLHHLSFLHCSLVCIHPSMYLKTCSHLQFPQWPPVRIAYRWEFATIGAIYIVFHRVLFGIS